MTDSDHLNAARPLVERLRALDDDDLDRLNGQLASLVVELSTGDLAIDREDPVIMVWLELVCLARNEESRRRSILANLEAQLQGGHRAGIEGVVTPYDLRHTATTLIAGAGLSADRLADMLGHKDTRMVFAHYRHRDGLTVTTAAEFWADGAV